MIVILLLIATFLLISIISLFALKTDAIQVHAEASTVTQEYPKELVRKPLSIGDLIKVQLSPVGLNDTLMVVKGNCLQSEGISNDDTLLISKITKPVWTVANGHLYLNGQIIPLQSTFLIFRFSQVSRENANQNFKIRKLVDFYQSEGSIKLVSVKYNEVTKRWDSAEHDIDSLLGILKRNVTTGKNFLKLDMRKAS